MATFSLRRHSSVVVLRALARECHAAKEGESEKKKKQTTAIPPATHSALRTATRATARENMSSF